MIEVLAPLSKGLVQLLGVLSIGLLIAIAFLDKDITGAVSNLGLIKKIKCKFEKIFKHINKEKYFNIVGSTPKYDNFNKTVYYEALIRNAQNN